MQVLAKGRGILLSDRVRDGGGRGGSSVPSAAAALDIAAPSTADAPLGSVMSARSVGRSAGALQGSERATLARAAGRL